MPSATKPVESSPSLKRVLGLPSAVVFGLSYMLPLTVFTTLGIANVLTEGNLPSAYLVTLVAMVFTALSYGHMVKAFPISGSAYTFSRRAFGGHIGFLAGWALLLDYLLLPMVTYLVIGIYLNAAFPAIPLWVFFVASLVLVTTLNIIGIRLLAGVNVGLLVFQFVFLGFFVFMSLGSIAGVDVPNFADVFFNDQGNLTVLLAGAALLCFSFLGFDAVSTLAEEAHEPRKTIPRAILIVTVFGGLLFIALAMISNLVFPDFTAYTSVDAASLDVVAAAGGEFLVNFFTAAYVAGCVASVLASQATVARILFAMGRDGVLPRRVFGKLHPRFRTPAGAILVVSGISLLGLALGLEMISLLISFGALVAFTMVNLSVIKHYVVDGRRRTPKAMLVYGLLPAIGVALTLWLWTSLSPNALMVGIGWVVVGFIYLLGLTHFFTKRPPELDMREVEPEESPEREPVAH
ncbi:APC family permease [Agromyces sp. C10]|uniref:APC family permease n=1 Tax=Agromyces sp. C10 TaxID=2935077 RepID=UPI00200ACDC6|nr:APC family permease [Agromyces sp. C10]MCK8610092.1 APC family permease [Agromyces sp. C10]